MPDLTPDTVAELRRLLEDHKAVDLIDSDHAWERLSNAAVNALPALLDAVAAQRWVPVEERSPEHGTECLILHGGARWRRVAVWRGLSPGDGLWFSVPDDHALTCVTHWRPLPDPPGDGG